MLLGHLGVALGAKRWGQDVSLGTLVLAAFWADLLWPILVFAGVERVGIEPGITAFNDVAFLHYPWSHSLLLVIFSGVALGGIYYGYGERARGAVLVGAVVASHWFLDFLVHVPDLPLWPGGPVVGLGLWNSLPATLLLEFGILAVGLTLYLRLTTGTDPVGEWGPWAIAALLAVVFLASSFGPTPGDGSVVAASALALWVLVPLAHWIDAHRVVGKPAHVRFT